MKTPRIGLAALVVLASAAAARADIVFSNVDATVTFDGTDTFDLQATPSLDGFEFDFTGTVPIYVDNVNADYQSAVVTISYDATSDTTINGLELIFTAFTLGGGQVSYVEQVFDMENNLLAEVNGTVSGTVVVADFLSFQGLTNYHVEKTFTLDLGQGDIVPSFASMGLVEQNAVPEPASMAALGLGALGLLARKRRK